MTTALGEGFPKPALIGWAANTTRDYAVDHWDELSEMGPAEKIKVLSKARYADRDAAGNAGTAVHGIAQALAAGDEVDVPEALVGHVDSYLKFVADWDPLEALTEAIVVNRRFGYMGTLDVVARSPTPDIGSSTSKPRGRECSGKTGCNSRPIGTRSRTSPARPREWPMIRRSSGPASYGSGPTDTTSFRSRPSAEEFRIFLYALGIANWRDSESVVGEALAAPDVQRRSDGARLNAALEGSVPAISRTNERTT